ncbi:MAG: hypothetical protein WBK91_09820 [Alphaproteobacteria bacterium]
MHHEGLILTTAATPNNTLPLPPLSSAAVLAARTLLVLCKPREDGTALSVADALRVMDGDPGLPEVSGRLPDNGNNSEAHAATVKLVEDMAAAAQTMLQRYDQQPATKSSLTRLSIAAQQAPKAANILAGILVPAFRTNAPEPAHGTAQDVRAIKILRYVASPLQS